MSHIHFAKYTNRNPSFDETWKYGKVDATRRSTTVNTWFVNGEYQPTICMTAGEWIKFKFGHIESTEDSRTYYIGDEESGYCTQYLLAKDGVIVHGLDNSDLPRSVGSAVFMAHSSRVDLAVSCPGDEVTGSKTYPIWLEHDDDGNGQLEVVIIAYITVTGTATEPASELTSFKPIRPDYLENLMPGKYDGDWEYQKYEWCEGFGPNLECNDLDYLKDMEVSGTYLPSDPLTCWMS